ncbi:MAG TPA: hypothetical protein VJT49_07205 [Amycolatopsis sp.]|uniref:hypothetical protein n=1 Tax=Amycolatopsis sp. TaxID=37632 RepID=UPI002B4813D2|nr:hypothetical protein [Amycolatopsis sp.]HKS44894.1 hypothetical protein [Amycolatopsis sp.]
MTAACEAVLPGGQPPNPRPGASRQTPEAGSDYHRGSHRGLLVRAAVADARPADVDAIIVPTARPAVYLRNAFALGRELGCPLVALCSKRSRAWEVEKLARHAGVTVIAVDTDRLPHRQMPDFETTEMVRGTRFSRLTDTSFKRNLGLLLARIAGWQRIVFLDDDITVPIPGNLRDAAGLLERHATAGLANGGFPDNSVVCHAYRASGGPQDTFIGGGALAVSVGGCTTFFPSIYNEDWFFLLDDDRLRPAAVTGLAVQAPYDPYADVRRARAEELGDCLAEGVFGLLDIGCRIADATAGYWRDFLVRRRLFIDEVIGRVRAMDAEPAERAQMIAALKAARGRSWLIEPELCAGYLKAFQADRDAWRCYLDGPGPEKVVAELGLAHRLRS